ncbi:MAG: hypothetical protein ACYTG0_03255 [Planctomycetota bacterium]|jgi:hypothetical protein
MNVLDRLISQLDTLVAFLALSREEVFNIIRRHHAQWFDEDNAEAIPDSYALYQTQVAHAAFVLGYSYAEAFLTDLIREIYAACPVALPRDKELKFRDVLERSTYNDVLGHMIDKEVLAVMYNSMDRIVAYSEDKFGLQWPSTDTDTIVEASLLRNCIVHNNAVTDSRLAAHSSRWSEGDTITLSA